MTEMKRKSKKKRPRKIVRQARVKLSRYFGGMNAKCPCCFRELVLLARIDEPEPVWTASWTAGPFKIKRAARPQKRRRS